MNIPRTDVNQFGELIAIDRLILEQPTVSLDFTYLVQSLWNERVLGFTISSGTTNVSAISGILSRVSDDKNYFIKTVKGDNDVVGNTVNDSTTSVIGIGNGFLTSYTAEGSVGNFPTCTVNIEALNMKIDTTPTSKGIPAVNPVDGTAITANLYTIPDYTSNPTGKDLTISALRPGDITATLYSYGEPGADTADWKLQSYNISFDLSRTPLQKLGSKYAFSREIDFPATVTCSFTANVGDITTGNMVDLVSRDANYDVAIRLHRPGLSQVGANVAVEYLLKSGKVDSQEFSSAIGDNKSVTLTFSTQLGGASSIDRGIFLSGLS